MHQDEIEVFVGFRVDCIMDVKDIFRSICDRLGTGILGILLCIRLRGGLIRLLSSRLIGAVFGPVDRRILTGMSMLLSAQNQLNKISDTFEFSTQKLK